MRKNVIATGAVAGALLLGSAGAALLLPSLAAAADPSAAPAASPSATGAPSNDGAKGGAFGGTTEAVSDTSVAAKALGISESDLTTALQGGKSIADVAKAQNVDVQKVIDALVQDKKDEIAAALKAGTITQAQADQQLAGATAFVTNQVNQAGFGGGRGGHGGPGNHGGPGGLDADDLTAAAKALGMTEADLTTALNSGKTAAAVAKDKGVDVQKVIDAIVASDKAEFAAAVKAGTMTQAQADQMAANLTAHVTDEVNGVAGGPGGFGGRGHGGPGGQGGPGNGNAAPNASPSAGTGTTG